MLTVKEIIGVIKMGIAMDRAPLDKRARPRKCPHGRPPRDCSEAECVAKWVIDS